MAEHSPSFPPYYHGIIKKYVVTFASIFDNILFQRDDNSIFKVPVVFTQKEKFVAYFQERPDLNKAAIESIQPKIAFELNGFNFDPDRNTNPMNRIASNSLSDTKFMWNRVPYDFMFSLYIATRSLEDAYKLMERILPLFNPSINLTINEMEDWGMNTDIQVVLNSQSIQVDVEGSFDSRRNIISQVDFTLKGYLYGPTREQERIREHVGKISWIDWETKVFDTQTIF